MKDQSLRPTFAVCVANDGCDDLSAGMLYAVLPDDFRVRPESLTYRDESSSWPG